MLDQIIKYNFIKLLVKNIPINIKSKPLTHRIVCYNDKNQVVTILSANDIAGELIDLLSSKTNNFTKYDFLSYNYAASLFQGKALFISQVFDMFVEEFTTKTCDYQLSQFGFTTPNQVISQTVEQLIIDNYKSVEYSTWDYYSLVETFVGKVNKCLNGLYTETDPTMHIDIDLVRHTSKELSTYDITRIELVV